MLVRLDPHTKPLQMVLFVLVAFNGIAVPFTPLWDIDHFEWNVWTIADWTAHAYAATELICWWFRDPTTDPPRRPR